MACGPSDTGGVCGQPRAGCDVTVRPRRAFGFGEPNGTRNLDPDELVDLLAQAGDSLSVVQMPVNLRDIVGTSDLENIGGTTYALGTVVPVASGGTVTLRGQVYLDTGATLTKLRLIRNGAYVCDLTGPSWSKTVSTTSDCYYRVELITSGGTSYTNPIFLNVP